MVHAGSPGSPTAIEPDAACRLSIAFRYLSAFPVKLQSCAPTLKCLDASHNLLTSLHALDKCVQLEALILDKNLLKSDCKMPHLPNLRCDRPSPVALHGIGHNPWPHGESPPGWAVGGMFQMVALPTSITVSVVGQFARTRRWQMHTEQFLGDGMTTKGIPGYTRAVLTNPNFLFFEDSP